MPPQDHTVVPEQPDAEGEQGCPNRMVLRSRHAAAASGPIDSMRLSQYLLFVQQSGSISFLGSSDFSSGLNPIPSQSCSFQVLFSQTQSQTATEGSADRQTGGVKHMYYNYHQCVHVNTYDIQHS